VTGWSPLDPDQMVLGCCAGCACLGLARGVCPRSPPLFEVLGSHGFGEECSLRLVRDLGSRARLRECMVRVGLLCWIIGSAHVTSTQAFVLVGG
jgi:hypothetical protein